MINSGSSIFPRPISRIIHAPNSAHEEFSRYASPEAESDGGATDGERSRSPILSERLRQRTEMEESGRVFPVEIPGGLIPERSKCPPAPEIGKHMGGRTSNPETYVSKRTYGQSGHSFFESEWAMVALLRNTFNAVSKVLVKWTGVGVLGLDYAGGGNGANDSRGHDASTPQCAPESQHRKDQKRSSRTDDEIPEDDGAGAGAGANGSGGYGDDGKDDKTTGGRGTKKPGTAEEQRRLACPYFKHDPVKFNRSTCCGPGFITVHRVK